MRLHHRVYTLRGLHIVWFPTSDKCDQSVPRNIWGAVSHLKKSHDCTVSLFSGVGIRKVDLPCCLKPSLHLTEKAKCVKSNNTPCLYC